MTARDDDRRVLLAAEMWWRHNGHDITTEELTAAVGAMITNCQQCDAGGHTCPGDGNDIPHGAGDCGQHDDNTPQRPDWWTSEHERAALAGVRDQLGLTTPIDDRRQRAREAFWDASAPNLLTGATNGIETAIETATRVRITPEIIDAFAEGCGDSIHDFYGGDARTGLVAAFRAAGFEVEE